MFYLRAFAMLLWMSIACVMGLLLVPFYWGNPSLNMIFGRLFAIPCAWICGLEVVVEGREHFTAHQPCVFVGNHQSGYDMVVFGHVFPGGTVVVGKRQLLWIPFFGLFFKAAGNILLNREKRVSALAGLSAAVKEIRARNLSVLIFPEGTRNTGETDLLPFKKGAFYMAIQAGVPVVPFVGSRLAPMVNWSDRRMVPGRVWVRALPPVPTQGLSEKGAEELARRVRAMMVEAMRTLPVAEPRRSRVRSGVALGVFLVGWMFILGGMVATGCTSAAKREERGTHHRIGHLIPYTLKVRRPVGAGANPVAGPGGEDYASRPLPDARLDCQSLDTLFAELKLDEVQTCFSSLNTPRLVSFHLRRETQPYLEIDDDEATPVCLKATLARIPVPREVIYQSVYEDQLRCYASRLDLEAGERLGVKLPVSKVAVQAEFPLRDPVATPVQVRMVLMSWVMSLFREEGTQYWDGRVLPDHLCEVCLGRKSAWKRGDAPLPSWPAALDDQL